MSAARPGLSPFTDRVADLVKGAARTVAAGATVREAATGMREARVGSLVVTEGEVPVGIVTRTDLADRVVAAGRGADTPVREVMSAPLVTAEAGEPIFEALMTMIRAGTGHLAVMEHGRLAGVISQRDWLTYQERHPAALFRAIDEARSVADVAALRAEAAAMVGRLPAEGGGAGPVLALLSELNGRVARRVVELALAGQPEPPPVPFAWIAMGSLGRREQTLPSDQDHGILFADVPPQRRDAVQQWFLRLAGQAVAGLEACGFPRCPGGIMATNPALCQPLAGWVRRFEGWLAEPEPEAVLHAAICFDFRPVYGEAALADTLWETLLQRIEASRGFLRFLAGGVLERRPPGDTWWWRTRLRLGWAPGELDLKRLALAPLVQGVRVLALAHGIADTPTLERLERLRQAGALPPERAEAAAGAFRHLMGLRLGRQFARAARGEAPDNRLALAALDPLSRGFLLDALQVVRDLQDEVAAAFGAVAPGAGPP